MADAIDKAVRAQGGAVVKPHQVKAMILAARRAYMEQAKAGLVDDGVGFDAWRRATLHDVVGPSAPDSFRAVTQRDYAAVIGYFQELAGDRRAEARRPDTMRSDDEQARALWSLGLVEGETADAFGGREGARRYADALFAKIHKTNRFAATARQVWAVIFTLRKRARKRAETPATPRRSKTALGARGAAGVHLPLPGASKRFPAFSRGL
ncbi:MAG: hypothetical protein IKO72_00590 [Kiritimatiellae bacterium]|nr:hypothetical protein [Kiritimatiellia bacterium]